MTASTCPQCGASFECCPQPDQRCWCLDLPPLPLQDLGQGANSCYCPNCLKARLSAVGAAASPHPMETGRRP